MKKGRDSMGSTKHGKSGHCRPSGIQKQKLMRDENRRLEEERKIKKSTTVFVPFRELFGYDN